MPLPAGLTALPQGLEPIGNSELPPGLTALPAGLTPINDEEPPAKPPEVKTPYTLEGLGAKTNPQYPNLISMPSGVSYDKQTGRVWLPKAEKWLSRIPTGVTTEDNKPIEDQDEGAEGFNLLMAAHQEAPPSADPEAALRARMKLGKGPEMVSSHAPATPGNVQDWGDIGAPIPKASRVGTEINPNITTETTPQDIAGTGIGLKSEPTARDFARIVYHTPERIAEGTVRAGAGGAAMIQDMFSNGGYVDENGNYFKLSPDELKGVEKSREEWLGRAKDAGDALARNAPQTEEGKIFSELIDMPATVAKYAVAGPLAPALMGFEAASNKYLDAIESGSTRDQATAAAAIDGAVGTAIGLIPGIKNAKSIVQYAMMKLGRGFVLGTAMHGSSALTTFIYNPEEAKRQLKNPLAYAHSIATVLAYESLGIPEEVKATRENIARARGEAAPEVKPAEAPPRTKQDIIADIQKLDPNDPKAAELWSEYDKAPEAQKPEAIPTEEEPQPQTGTEPQEKTEPNKRNRREELGYGLDEQEAQIEDLRTRHQEAVDRLRNVEADLASPNKGRNRRGQRDYGVVMKDVLDLSNQLQELTGTTPEALTQSELISGEGSEFAKKWRQIRAEQRARLKEHTGVGQANEGIGGALNYVISEGFHATKDVGRLIAAAVKDGARSAKDFMDRMKENLHPDDWEDLKAHWGGDEGIKKLWDENQPPPVDIVDSTSYKGERQGNLLGPNDEMIVARDPETGKDVGKLWVTKEDGGFTVRKVETDPSVRGRGVARSLYEEAYKRYGEYKGATDQTEMGRGFMNRLRETNPEIFGEETGETKEVASGLDPFKAIRSMAEAAKRELGLPEGASDGDLAKAVMDKIGRLGTSVKETAVKIMGKVAGITREAAEAIAAHLHEAFGGSRESQAGFARIKGEPGEATIPEAANPELEAHRKANDERRAWIKENIADKEQRKLLYARLPQYRPEVKPSPTLIPPAPKGGGFRRESIGETAKGIAKGVGDIFTDIPKQVGTDEGYKRLHEEMKASGQFQEGYKNGSYSAPEAAASPINPEMPKVIGDFKKGEGPGSFEKTVRSPHNIWEVVFGDSNPAVDAVRLVMHKAKMGYEYGKFMMDVMKGVPDASGKVKDIMKPIFDDFVKEKAAKDELERRMGKELDGVEDKDQRKAIKDKYKSDLDTKSANLNEVMDRKNKAIQDLAQEHPDARIALAAEQKPGEYPEWLKLSADEEKRASALRDFTKKMKTALDKVGIKTLGDDDVYITHMAHFLNDDASLAGRQNLKSVLNFKHRESDVGQWLPSAHAFGDTYIPSVVHKLATQPFLNKWGMNGGALDRTNTNGLTNPLSPNRAPGAAKYLSDMITKMQNPVEPGFFGKANEIARNITNTMLLGFNPRVGYKHLVGKGTALMGEHHSWTPNASKSQIQAALGGFAENHPGFQKALETMGLNKDGLWQKKKDLLSHFVIPREIMGSLKDDPFVAEVSGRKAPRNAFTKGAGQVYRSVRDNPVKAIETWENGLNTMASLARAKGMGWDKAQDAVMKNILDFNFRGGADAPELTSTLGGRMLTQFAQTPMKSTELKAKLITNALRGGKDIFGTDHTAKLVRQIMAYGAVTLAGKKLGMNVADSLYHAGVINQDLLEDLEKGAKEAVTGNWSEAKRRAYALYGDIAKGAVTTPPSAQVIKMLVDMGVAASSVKGAKNKVKSAIHSLPVYKQVGPIADLARREITGETKPEVKVPYPYSEVKQSPESMKGLSDSEIARRKQFIANMQNITGTVPERVEKQRYEKRVKLGKSGIRAIAKETLRSTQ